MQSKNVEKQLEKCKQAARELECNPDEARWEKNLRKVMRPEPLEKPYES
jgi:chaperonin cofactor prefoldin